MDLVNVLNEDHERLRWHLLRLEGQLQQRYDEKGDPHGWTVRSESVLRDQLKEFLRALGAHEDVEEKILFKALVEAGTLDVHPLKNLEHGHRQLDVQVRRLAGMLDGAPSSPMAGLVAATMDLCETLRAHMQEEEYSLFPFIRSTLPEAMLQKLGSKAAARLSSRLKS